MTKPLTQENQTWFIENGNADHEGQLYANDLGSRLEGDKACFVKVDDVRSAIKGMRETFKRNSMAPEWVDSVIDKWFPVFAENKEVSDE